MRSKCLMRGCWPAACLACLFVSVTLSAQSTAQASGSGLQARSRTSASRSPKPEARGPYTPPRTPWGDPDLHGNFTYVNEQGTPLERPDQFAGHKIGDVKGEELASIKRAAQDRTIKSFQSWFDAPDHWWQDALSLEKGAQAWLIATPSPSCSMSVTRGTTGCETS